MANIFQLYGSIFIDNEKANASIDETTKKGKESGTTVGEAFSKIASGAAAVGTAVIGAAAALGKGAYDMAMSTATTADEIDKLSERTGIGAEELQRYMHACDQSGVSSDSLTTAVKKASKAIEEAGNGSKTYTEALSSIGLSYKDLEGLSMEEQFEAITNALADMDEGSERNALGAQLLGGAYTEMLPLLNAGSEGIANLKNEADELGIVMSGEDVTAGVALGDTIANIKAACEGLMNSLGSAVIPIIQEFADKIIENMPKIQSMIQKVIPVLVNLFEKLAPPLFDLVDALLPVILDLVTELTPIISNIITSILPVIVSLIESLSPLLTTIIEGILPIIVELLNLVMPILIDLISMILPPIIDLINTLLPIIFPIVQEILPVLIDLLKPILEILNLVLPPLAELITYAIPMIAKLLANLMEKVLPVLRDTFGDVAEVVGGAFTTVFEALSPLFDDIKKVFENIMEFITNVFTGDWEAAWDNVKGIFVSIWDAISDAVKVPINFIIDGINMMIRGLNSVSFEVPDWVPVIGGQTFGFAINEIAHLRRGIDYVPYDEYPALLHKGEQVLTASEAKENRKEDGETKATTWNISMPITIDRLEIAEDQDINHLADELMEALQDKIERKGAVFA